MIRGGRPGWTPTGRWCRSRSRTAAAGTVAVSPAAWIGFGWPQGSTGPYLPQAVIAALHATATSWEQTDWRTICVAYDKLSAMTRFAGGAGQPGPGGGFPRRPRRRAGRAGEGRPRPAPGPVQPGRVDTRGPAAARRTTRRRPQLVPRGVGVQRFRAGPRLSAPADRRVRRIIGSSDRQEWPRTPNSPLRYSARHA